MEAGCTAKTQYRKFETHIPRKGITWPQSQFPHSYMCVSDLYIPTIGLTILLPKNMGTGLGIHKWDFRLQCVLGVGG